MERIAHIFIIVPLLAFTGCPRTPVVPKGFAPGLDSASPSAVRSSVTVDPRVVADGVASAQVTITLRSATDAPVAGVTPTIATDASATLSTCSVSNDAGISTCAARATVASPVTIRIATPIFIEASPIQFINGPATEIRFLQNPPNAAAGDLLVVIAQLFDAHGNAVLVGDDSTALVSLSLGSGSTGTLLGTTNLHAIGGKADFTSAQLHVGVVGTKTLHATAKNFSAESLAFTIVPGTVAIGSTLTATPALLIADGVTTTTLGVTLLDAFGNPLVNQPVSLAASGVSNTFVGVIAPTDGTGHTSATLKSTKAGLKTISITTPAGLGAVTALVEFAAGGVNAARSTLVASPTSVVANGTATSLITATLRDANDNPVAGKNVSLVAGSGSSVVTVLSGQTNVNGQVTFSVKDANTETITYSATDTTDAITIAQTANVSFLPGAVSAALSTVVASPTSVTADGATTSTVTVTLRDTLSNPVPGKTVSITTNRPGSDVVATISATTNGSGAATFTVASETLGLSTINATDATDSLALTATAGVTFVAGAPAVLTLTGPTTGNAGSCLGPYTVSVQDSHAHAANVSGLTYLLLNGLGHGAAYTNSGCTVLSNSGLGISVANATSSKTFYFKTAVAESLTVSPSNGGIWSAGSLGVVVGPAGASALALGLVSATPTVDVCQTLDVTSVDLNGNTTNVAADTAVTLSGNLSALLYANSDCTGPVSGVTIAAGTNHKRFYAKDSQTESIYLGAGASGLLSGYVLVTFAGGAPAKIALSGPGSISAGACRAYTVSLLDANNRATYPTTDKTIALAQNANAAIFSNVGCTTAISARTVAAYTNSSTIYLRDDTIETVNIDGSLAGLTPATLPIQVHRALGEVVSIQTSGISDSILQLRWSGAQGAISGYRIAYQQSATPPADCATGTVFDYSGAFPPALAADLRNISAVAADADGNVYVASAGLHQIFKIDPAGNATVLAGTGTYSNEGDGGPAKAAALYNPIGLAVDRHGNIFVSDSAAVRKIDANGIITLFAGSYTSGNSGDGGAATSAQIGSPTGLAIDSSDNLYIVDSSNNVVRMVDASGTISTFAGDGTTGYTGDYGAATSASLHGPTNIAVSPAGVVYIADEGNYVVRAVSGGIITTYAGMGLQSSTGDGGLATAATLDPINLAVASDETLYVGDNSGHSVRRIDPLTGLISTFAGTGGNSETGDGGAAASASLSLPYALALNDAGELYIASAYLRKVDTGGTITAAAGRDAASASLSPYLSTRVSGLSAGATYAFRICALNSLADISTGATTVVVPSLGEVSELAATSSTGGQLSLSWKGGGGEITGYRIAYQTGNVAPADCQSGTVVSNVPTQAANATISGTRSIALDSSGNVFFVSEDGLIRTVDASGNLSVVAGNGADGFSASAVTIDASGNLFVGTGARLLKITPSGVVTTIAGIGYCGYSGDGGQATSAAICVTGNLAIDAAGNIYFADMNSQHVRKIDVSGVITTIAGNGSFGFSGDGGPATAAMLAWPENVALDTAGNLYVTDVINGRIRKVNNSGVISTVAGNGTVGTSGDGGLATAARINPIDVRVDASGNIFFSEYSRIRRVNNSGVISTVAGSDNPHYYDNGPANDTYLGVVGGLAIDASGRVLVANNGRSRIARFTPGGAMATLIGGGTSTLPGINQYTLSVTAGVPYSARVCAVNSGGSKSIGATVSASANLSFALVGNGATQPNACEPYQLKLSDAAGHPVASSGLAFAISTSGGTHATIYADAGCSTPTNQVNLTSASATIYLKDSSFETFQLIATGNGNSYSSSLSVSIMPLTVAYLIGPNFTPGSAISILGSGFNSSSAVSVGGVACAITLVTVGQITCVVGPATPANGTVTVTAPNGGGSSSTDYPAGLSQLLVTQLAAKRVHLRWTMSVFNSTFRLAVQAGGTPPVQCVGGSVASYTPSASGLYLLAELDVASPALLPDTDYTLRVCAVNGSFVSSGVTISIHTPLATDMILVDNGVLRAIDQNDVINLLPSAVPGEASLEATRNSATGDVYYVDTSANVVRKVSAGGVRTIAVGTGSAAYSGDGGQATSARLNAPTSVRYRGGYLFIADTGNSVIRRVDGSGVITTVAGTGTPGYTGDSGAATSARLSSPQGIDFDGTTLYIADTGNHVVRAVSGGTITTFAGSSQGYSGDGGAATAAQLNQPQGVASDALGNVYIADTGNQSVRVVNGGIINLAAGDGASCGATGDSGPASAALLCAPKGLAFFTATSSLVIDDSGNHAFRRIDSGGTLTSFGPDAIPQSGIGLTAFDSHGNLFVSSTGFGIYRLRYPTLQVTGGIVDATPTTLAADTLGNIFWSDANCGISRYDGSVAQLIAGSGACGAYAGDGATAVGANTGAVTITALTADGSGNVFYFEEGDLDPGDFENIRHIGAVRKIDSQGALGTVLGNYSYYPYSQPSLAVSNGGVIYMSYEGVVTTVETGVAIAFAGGGSLAPDGIAATQASIGQINGLSVDGAGNLYLALAAKFYKVAPTGIIYRITGAYFGATGDGLDAGDPSVGLANLTSFAVH